MAKSEVYDWWCKECGANGTVPFDDQTDLENLVPLIETAHQQRSSKCAQKGLEYNIIVSGPRINEVIEDIRNKHKKSLQCCTAR